MAINQKHLSEENDTERVNLTLEARTSLPAQMIVVLTELWCKENGRSSIYMAQTLDQIGVEKYLPGSAEVFSGTLSLLRTSLPPSSSKPCAPSAVVIEHVSNLLTLFLALHHSERESLCETVLLCGWPRQLSYQLIPRVRVLARAFKYADLAIPADDRHWTLLEHFQRRFYRLNNTVH